MLRKKSRQRTYRQVTMAATKDGMRHMPGLASCFFKELFGHRESNALFKGHVFQKILILETKAGVKVHMSSRKEDDRRRFEHGANVLLPRKQSVEDKVKSVSEGFVDCVPHLVS